MAKIAKQNQRKENIVTFYIFLPADSDDSDSDQEFISDQDFFSILMDSLAGNLKQKAS